MAKFFNKLIGAPEHFSVSHRILNGTGILGVVSSFLGAVNCFFLELPAITIVTPIISSLYFLFGLLYSLKYRKLRIYYNLSMAYISFVFIPSSWLFNGASDGGFHYFIFLFIVISITMTRYKERWFYSISLLIIAIILLIIEYHYPELVVGYPSRSEEMIDVGISMILSLVSIVTANEIFMSIYQKTHNKLEEKNELLHNKNEEIYLQKQIIEKSHKYITDSINYAKKIQNAIFPSLDLFKNNLSDYFIIFKPLNVVSGDFYWATKINDYFIFVAADCTGHGVPGAFVSMLGISFLKEIVNRNDNIQAGKTLDTLREEIKNSLNQNHKNERQEGMDIAFCALNTKNNILQFAGANNPLYLFRNNELIEYKADRQPIGLYRKERPFKNHEIQLEKNDQLYIFSDGFIDQFGGDKNKKFMKKNFKNLLTEIQNENMDIQNKILEDEFKKWKGTINQIDDVLVIGVKI